LPIRLPLFVYTDQDVVVGTLGNRGWQKNQGMIVDIACRLRDQNLPFKFAICGNPLDTNVQYFESKVTKPIAKHGLAQGDYVRVFAQTVAPEIIMNAFDIFILTSVAEGASLVTAEALATGLPVVATDVGSLPDVVHENENGMLVPVNDIEGAAHALRRLADPELRATMGRQSNAIAESSVSSERCAAAHVEAYRRALRTDSCRDAAQSVAGPVSASGTQFPRASRPQQGMAGEGTTPGG
jgi:glycosyltransferase involved in cell wall biosynthesis